MAVQWIIFISDSGTDKERSIDLQILFGVRFAVELGGSLQLLIIFKENSDRWAEVALLCSEIILVTYVCKIKWRR